MVDVVVELNTRVALLSLKVSSGVGVVVDQLKRVV